MVAHSIRGCISPPAAAVVVVDFVVIVVVIVVVAVSVTVEEVGVVGDCRSGPSRKPRLL